VTPTIRQELGLDMLLEAWEHAVRRLEPDKVHRIFTRALEIAARDFPDLDEHLALHPEHGPVPGPAIKQLDDLHRLGLRAGVLTMLHYVHEDITARLSTPLQHPTAPKKINKT
jgi:hypothetical protein